MIVLFSFSKLNLTSIIIDGTQIETSKCQRQTKYIVQSTSQITFSDFGVDKLVDTEKLKNKKLKNGCGLH